MAAVSLIVAALTARMLHGAFHHARLAKAAQAAGQWQRCQREYRRAMAYYLPGNPWVKRAERGLVSLAEQFEAAGKADLALGVWRELRSAILMLRGAFHPYADELQHANHAIVRLSRGKSRRATDDTQRRKRLNAPPEPHRGFTALGLLGFVGWLTASFALIVFGLDRHGNRQQRFWRLLGLNVCCFGLFCLGMGLA